jgi:hypothetical protein
LLLKIDSSEIPQNNAQHFLLNAAEKLRNHRDITPERDRHALLQWARGMPNPTDSDRRRIAAWD